MVEGGWYRQYPPREQEKRKARPWGTKTRQTYICMGEAQSTVSFTCGLPTVKTRVCHWLSASRVPRNTQCSIAPPWPLKRKCRHFREILSPRMMRRGSSLLLFRLLFFSLSFLFKASPLSSSSSSSSSADLFSTFLGSTMEKTYSLRCKTKRKTHYMYTCTLCRWKVTLFISSCWQRSGYLQCNVSDL